MVDVNKILDELVESKEPFTYIGLGTHKLKLSSYSFLDGSGYRKVVGPAFNFEVVESTDPSIVGTRVSRVVNINLPPGQDQAKRDKMLGIRKREIVDIMKSLFIGAGEMAVEDAFTFDDIKDKLQKVDALNTGLAGSMVMARGIEAAAKDSKGNPFVNVRFAPVL